MMRILLPLAAAFALSLTSVAFAADPVNVEIAAVEEEPGSLVITLSAIDAEGRPFTDLAPSDIHVILDDTQLPVGFQHRGMLVFSADWRARL